jgi:hypothetical protein
VIFVSAENRVTVAREGLELFFQSLKLHSNHSGVQESGCGALYNLAYNGKSRTCVSFHTDTLCVCTSVDIGVEIVKKGGIELLLQSMKLHPNCDIVQEHVCGALHNLAKTGMNIFFRFFLPWLMHLKMRSKLQLHRLEELI